MLGRVPRVVKLIFGGLACFPRVIKCTLLYLGNYIHTLLQINKMSFLLFNIVQFKAIVSRYLVPPLFRISGSFTKGNNYLPWKQKQKRSLPKLHWLWARRGVKVRIPN